MKRSLYYILILVYFMLFCASSQASGALQSAQVHLSLEELKANAVTLTGEALFYHEHLYDLDDIQGDTTEQHYLLIGRSWASSKNYISTLNEKTFGTYYFKLFIPQELVGQSFSLTTADFISCASNIMVSGKYSGGSGRVGTSLDDPAYIPSRHMQSYSFVADTCVLDVVIQSSNFDGVQGGIFYPLIFGLDKHVVRARERMLARDLLIITSLLVVVFSHIMTRLIDSNKKELIYYPILCLLVAIDILFKGSAPIFVFFPDLPFAFYSPLHLLIPFFLPGFTMLFLDALYPGYLSKKLALLSLLFALSCSIITICIGSQWHYYFTQFFFIEAVLLVSIGFTFPLRLIKAKTVTSQLFFGIYLILALCIYHDVFKMLDFIHTPDLFPIGVLFFVLFLGILSGKYRNYQHSQFLSATNDLELKKLELEDKVGLRSIELRHTLKELNKLHNVQQKVTNVVVRDLKKSLEPLIQIQDVNPRDYRHLRDVGYHMLNMIHNMLDIYRFNNKRILIRKSTFQPDKVVNTVISDLSFLRDRKKVSIELSQQSFYELSADLNVFNRLIVNLLTSILACAPQRSSVRIRIELIEATTLQVSFSNESPPLSKEQRQKMFTPFFIADDNTNLDARKTQLALYTCKLAVEAHGGSIRDDITDTTGVTVQFTLPGASVIRQDIDTDIDAVRIALTSDDIAYLLPFVKKLSCLEVYDQSDVEVIVAQISQQSDGLILWCKSIYNACYQLDNEACITLLKLVNGEQEVEAS